MFDSATGDRQSANGAPSSAHSNRAPAWSEANANAADVVLTRARGAPLIMVSGNGAATTGGEGGDASRTVDRAVTETGSGAPGPLTVIVAVLMPAIA
jgi:hypothetical protein